MTVKIEWQMPRDDDGASEFEVGDVVLLVNPYMDFAILMDKRQVQFHFEITSVRWDVDDHCYRYQLDNKCEWYAECWLMEPDFPEMYKEDLTTKGLTVKVNIDALYTESFTKQLTIDNALDLMNSSVLEERLYGEKVLRGLTATKGDDQDA